MKTKFLTKEEATKQAEWKLIDAAGVPVGRLATKVASVIRGKHKVNFTPHNNCGDFVVVINAEKAVFTGKKLQQKTYYHHTGFIGGIKERKASDLMQSKPEEVIEMAVHGMLPKNSLGHQMKKRLRVVRGAEHNYKAHKPELITAAK